MRGYALKSALLDSCRRREGLESPRAGSTPPVFRLTMKAAGHILTGMRKYRPCAHAPAILAHDWTTSAFALEEREKEFPAFESFEVWEATVRVLWKLRDIDELPGQYSLGHFAHGHEDRSRTIIICTRQEAKRAQWEARRIIITM